MPRLPFGRFVISADTRFVGTAQSVMGCDTIARIFQLHSTSGADTYEISVGGLSLSSPPPAQHFIVVRGDSVDGSYRWRTPRPYVRQISVCGTLFGSTISTNECRLGRCPLGERARYQCLPDERNKDEQWE